jgi:hypothetical protein
MTPLCWLVGPRHERITVRISPEMRSALMVAVSRYPTTIALSELATRVLLQYVEDNGLLQVKPICIAAEDHKPPPAKPWWKLGWPQRSVDKEC